jgi:hypothetical protein
MVEFILLIAGLFVGLGIGKLLHLTGARGALPARLQRTYDRNNGFAARRDRRATACREHERV